MGNPVRRPLLRVACRAITPMVIEALRAWMSESRKPLTYAESGVDIDVGNRIVDRIRPFARGTRRSGAGAELADSADCSILRRRDLLTRSWSPPTTASAQK